MDVVGARPQFVKAGIVSRALRSTGAICEVLVHTGQHYDGNMSKIFFDDLEIPRPGYDLGIGSAGHGEQTGRMLQAVEKVLLEEKPDWVLVYGDTNSTLAGAVAAAKLHMPVAHVEAGLRSFNRQMPEEINRVLTDHVSDLLFAPTTLAVKNLAAEGICGDRVRLVGDVMYDAALHYGAEAETHVQILARLRLEPKGYALATVHRAENTDDRNRLTAILGALGEFSKALPVVLPVHPRTRKLLQQITLPIRLENLHLIDPVGYLEMVMLEKNARLIATDSGGVQKEAFFYQVPCVTLREETEWLELVDLGWNRLAPPGDSAQILAVLEAALRCPRGQSAQPYGDGSSSRQIAELLLSVSKPNEASA